MKKNAPINNAVLFSNLQWRSNYPCFTTGKELLSRMSVFTFCCFILVNLWYNSINVKLICSLLPLIRQIVNLHFERDSWEKSILLLAIHKLCYLCLVVCHRVRFWATGNLRTCGLADLRTGQRVFCGPRVRTRSAKYPRIGIRDAR